MQSIVQMIYIFPIAITLHNIEEALWLPQWSQNIKKYHKPVERHEFHFAVLCVTALAYLISFLYVFYNDILIIRYMFFGFVGSMIINAIFPHLAVTIVTKKYAPGVLTGVLINVPCFSILLSHAIKYNVISIVELIIATVGVGLTILCILPLLFKLGNKFIRKFDIDKT